MFKQDRNYQTLITVPANDGNFKSALKQATDDDLNKAVQCLTDNPKGNKSRLVACRRELKRRELW